MYKKLCTKLMLVVSLLFVANSFAMKRGAKPTFGFACVSTLIENTAPLAIGTYYLAFNREAIVQNKIVAGCVAAGLAGSFVKNFLVPRIKYPKNFILNTLCSYSVSAGIAGYALVCQRDQIKNHPWMTGAVAAQFVTLPLLSVLLNTVCNRIPASTNDNIKQ